MAKNFILASIASLCALAQSEVPEPEMPPKRHHACIERTEAFGFVEDVDSNPHIEEGFIVGDIEYIHNEPIHNLAFARPLELLVCADENYVHGLELTILNYLPEAEENKDTPDAEELSDVMQAEMDYMDKMLADNISTYPQRMQLVGSYSPPCQIMHIEEEDRIVYIDVESDGKHLRRMHIHLASDTFASFGSTSDEEFFSERFEFTGELKVDIIGIFGFLVRAS